MTISVNFIDYTDLPKYHIQVSKIRASFHDYDLETERECYTRPRLDPIQRLCSSWLEVEGEEHFIACLRVNTNEQRSLFTKLAVRTRHLCILIIEKKLYFLRSAKTEKYEGGSENSLTSYSLLEIWKLIGRVLCP